MVLFYLLFSEEVAWLMGDIAVFLVLFTIACMLTLILQCIPVDAAWDFKKRLAKGTKCYSSATYLKIGKFNSGMSVMRFVKTRY